jgi:hypothetical protein
VSSRVEISPFTPNATPAERLALVTRSKGVIK